MDKQKLVRLINDLFTEIVRNEKFDYFFIAQKFQICSLDDLLDILKEFNSMGLIREAHKENLKHNLSQDIGFALAKVITGNIDWSEILDELQLFEETIGEWRCENGVKRPDF
ncbi:MAG: hypothetical protein ACOC80_13080 [Petrotogales bacterium]